MKICKGLLILSLLFSVLVKGEEHNYNVSKLLDKLPIQSGGRVKPFNTFAFHHDQTL